MAESFDVCKIAQKMPNLHNERATLGPTWTPVRQ